MRKIIATMMAILLCACAIVLISCESTERISVRYSATQGGIIEGIAYQSKEIKKGESATFATVSAKAISGYEFVSWSDGSTEATRTDTLSASTTLEATFKKAQITVTYKATEGGKIDGITTQMAEKGSYFQEVRAVAEEGYAFVRWDDDTFFEERLDIASESKTYTAIFEKIDYIEIEYIASQGGTLEGELRQKTDKKGESFTTVKAVADEGWRFSHWSDNIMTIERTDIASEDKSVVAIFVETVKVTFSPFDESHGEISGRKTQIVDKGSKTIPVTAVAKAGYKFVCWSNGEEDATMEFAPESDCEVFAIFITEYYELSAIYINTLNSKPVMLKDQPITCSVTAVKDDSFSVYNAGATIKGRGNTSWEESDKKPYKIKFEHKVDLFDMGEAKDWTFIPNYTDKSLIRNFITYKSAKIFDSLGATTDCELVELWLNGEYRGVYLACEQIEVADGRVEIDESLSELDTGYLIELDGRKDGNHFAISTTLRNNANSNPSVAVDRYYVIKSPDTTDTLFTPEHKAFIQSYIQNCITTLEQNSDYAKVCELIDVDSFAQAYIVFELFRAADVGFSSFYLHKDAGGKIKCGPVWDFDRGLGNINYNRDCYTIDNLYAKNSNEWFYGLLQFEEFKALVTKYLWDYKDELESTLNDLYDYVLSCPKAFERNFTKWDILDKAIYPNPADMNAVKTWQGQVEYVRDYVARSLAYLLTQYK